MPQRLKRMRILLSAQEQMQLSAQRAVDKATRELELLRQKELAVMALMSEGDTMMVNALMHSHINQIRQVSQLKQDMQMALETLKSETRKQAVSMEVVKRMVKMLEEEDRREREKRDHQEIVERTANQNEDL